MSSATANPFRNFKKVLSQNLEPDLRRYLFKVYSTMALTCAAAATGSIVHLTNLWTAGFLSIFLQIFTMVTLVLTPKRKTNRRFRLALLLVIGALSGHTLGLLIEQVMVVNPAFVITALLGTVISFGWLSLSAILARRGSHLMLGGVLSSVTCALVAVAVGNLFYQSWIVHKLSLYLALALMCGFVLFDTQIIMEEYRAGVDDYVAHALRLFFNVEDIFRLLMEILLTKSEPRNSMRRNADQNDE
ncbi:bax inhibitor 1 [Aedes albopictus]|uniref:Bax-mediated apoptosis inhibitor tegt/bi-1 n=1 Tax=Aedes albopictus TaxID=7160 RepID=A0ABM1Y6J4_AEDAL|nr:bax inhibitor 1-like [Aedes albopictus]